MESIVDPLSRFISSADRIVNDLSNGIAIPQKRQTIIKDLELSNSEFEAGEVETIKVLCVEDNIGDFVLVREMLSDLESLGLPGKTPFDLVRAESITEALAQVQRQMFDVILLDMSLPDAQGLGGVRRLQKAAPDTPLVLLTGVDDINIAMDAVYEGVQDYLVKGQVDGNVLSRALLYANERAKRDEERNHLENQIRNAQKLESLGLMAGGIAHDFNNLLVGILANVGLALREVSQESPLAERLIRIESTGRCAAELVRQLLAYSGKGKCVIREFNLNQVIEEIGNLLQGVISKSAIIDYQLSTESPTVIGDATQMRQVVMNLITNASEAISEHGGAILVRSGVLKADSEMLADAYLGENLTEGEYAYFQVSDNGVGISDEVRARMFDPFFTTKFTGRGLGLAAVLGIVRGHNGALLVDSAEGSGSSFTVLLPIGKEKNNKKRIKKTENLTDWQGSGTVLVVDDEKMVRIVAKEMLESFGFSVLVSEDGAEGIRIFEKHKNEINAVLLDLTMPNMSGEDVFYEIRRLKSDIPVVLSSGYDERDALAKFTGCGLAGFIQKPYGPKELVKKIIEVLCP